MIDITSTITPTPPSHCIKLLKNCRVCESSDGCAIIVRPVPVQPDMLSKYASRNGVWEPSIKGIAQKSGAMSQPSAAIVMACLASSTSSVLKRYLRHNPRRRDADAGIRQPGIIKYSRKMIGTTITDNRTPPSTIRRSPMLRHRIVRSFDGKIWAPSYF
uniref:Uncharacterized protein n=1 Tax=Candidatus Methanogaster sp. ANME-2c ERB4 TaxID=2759911 RepID=A0A7G9Y1T8_9EURY|nr:hypothetical protein CHNKNPLH_00001 [Methanosarcinales archaeon ANME-2c ERB4]